MHFINIAAALELDRRFVVDDFRRIIVTIHILREAFKSLQADNFLIIHLQLFDRKRREPFFNLSEIFLLNALPLFKITTVFLGIEHFIDQHHIDIETVEVQIGQSAHSLLDGHLFGVHHEPDRRVEIIGKNIADILKFIENLID